MDLYLDPATGDLPDVNRLIGGATEIRQRISLRLQRHLGEWFLDLTQGLPFERWAQQKPVRVGEIVARIRSEIEAVPGVIGTASFSGTQDLALRQVSVTGEFLVQDGTAETVSVGGTLSGPNVSYWGVYFGARQVHQPTAGPTGARYDFGVN